MHLRWQNVLQYTPSTVFWRLLITFYVVCLLCILIFCYWCMNIYGSYILIGECVLYQNTFPWIQCSLILILWPLLPYFIIFMVYNMFHSSVMMFWFSNYFLSSVVSLFISFCLSHCFIICFRCLASMILCALEMFSLVGNVFIKHEFIICIPLCPYFSPLPSPPLFW